MHARSRQREERRRRARRPFALALGISLAAMEGAAQADETPVEPSPSLLSVSPNPEPPPRPKELPPLEVASPPFTRHVDVGGGVALVKRVASGETELGDTSVRYPAALGFALWARWDLIRYLRANLYAVRSARDVDLPPGALGLPGDPGEVEVYTYSLGLRLAPTLPLGQRARAWVSGGVGWGRLELGRFEVASPSGPFAVRERVASFVEVPLGVGVSVDVVPGWLALDLETTGAFYVAQRGAALRPGQTIDATGRRVAVEPFPAIAGGFVTTLGLSLVL